MDRDSFNNLPISEQVNYFNNELKKDNNTFNYICKDIKISKNTILPRFEKSGYFPLRQGGGNSVGERQRILGFYKEEELPEQISLMKDLTTENSEVNPILESEKLLVKSIKVENSATKNKNKVNDPKDIDLILKRIELLEQRVEEYGSILSQSKEYENAIFRSDKNFINSYESTTTKTFKIDVEVYQELEKMFDKYNMYKRQDIVSSLLKYALDNIE